MKPLAQILRAQQIGGTAVCALLAAAAPFPLMANSADNGTLYWSPPHSKKNSTHAAAARPEHHSHPLASAHEHGVPSLAQQAVNSAAHASPTPQHLSAAQRRALLAQALAVTPSTPPRVVHSQSGTQPLHFHGAETSSAASHSVATTPSPASEQHALQTGIIISVPDQKLAIIQNGQKEATYTISTSRYGLGDGFGTYTTPLGVLEVAQKIGENLPEGSVFKGRHPTGEILKPNAPGRDPVVTRILWLRGTEECNRNAYSRGIYIHGTPEERSLGRPASFGCIRMRSRDVVKVFQDVAIGSKVQIANKSLRQIMRENASSAAASPSISQTADLSNSFPAASRTAKK